MNLVSLANWVRVSSEEHSYMGIVNSQAGKRFFLTITFNNEADERILSLENVTEATAWEIYMIDNNTIAGPNVTFGQTIELIKFALKGM